MSMTITQQATKLIDALPPEQQAQVLAFVQRLTYKPDPNFPAHIQPFGPPMSRAEYGKLIDEAWAEIQAGDGTPWEEFEKEMETW